MSRVLSHTPVTAPGAHPRSWLIILHGFFGAGRNWSTVARRLTAARTDWGAVLVDLRLHGASQGFPPPHTLAVCADDVIGLAGALDRPAPAVLGHSFGGKVALAYVARRPAGLRQAWIVDVDPSAAEPRGDAWQLLQTARTMPKEFTARGDLIAGLVRAGIEQRTAEWMATNLDRTETGYRWRLDFDALEPLLVDFFRADLWDTVEQPPPGVVLHFVKATRSTALRGPSVARLRRAAAAAAPRRAACSVHEVEGGHWLNADNPDGVVAVLNGGLPRCASP
jgi:esterase